MKVDKESATPVQEVRKPAHAHAYHAVTSVTLEHSHVIELFVYPANGDAYDGHTHNYQGHTQMAAGHFHRLIGTTGPAIALPDGSHVHEMYDMVKDEPFSFQGGYYSTEMLIQRHVHAFTGPTGKGIGYAPAGW
ncbi:YmaF family protein [Paenibacillus cremeus]|uniref:YmaF family protein n=1 Tax=Paenibacillus cremeus TaxID=2163881 RepID=A0A559KEL1_9BACL|nr:YmaF family protein [Paenibacillus cremeus]TVY10566.1 hypothetical protein FPZ49_07470 [Paenibacillus cremeus]